ncbi:MAG TPA: protein kinase [Kofleriaceae bacterium]|nr:protein kinase [Kofleriaceae bacterium]
MGSGDVETLPADGDVAPRPDAELPIVDPSCYELGEELARGGFGRLIRARDRRLDREVAIKQLRATNAQLETRFRLEARLTARLSHPAIVPVHEVGRWPSGEPFYAMKLVSGRSLRAVLDATPALVDRLALVPAIAELADAVGYAHREGVVHRDLKPSNLMLDDGGHAYVVDWGLAKDRRDDDAPLPDMPASADLTAAGSVLGTPPYLAPEQARGEPVDATADVYALGTLLYELIAGIAPYTGEPAAMLAAIASAPPPRLVDRQPSAPRELVAIVERAMARQPRDRYPHAGELADELRRFGRGELVRAYRYTAAHRAARWLRRHRGLAIASVAVVVASAGTALWFATRPAPVTWRPEVRELEAFEENSIGPSLSPDGTLVAFDSNRDPDGVPAPWIGPLDGTAHRVPTPNHWGSRVRFTRDGTQLLYRSTGGIWRARLDGSAAQLVVPRGVTVDDCGDMLVAARAIDDGSIGGPFQIVTVAPDGTVHEVVRIDGRYVVDRVRCSPDGRRILYSLAENLDGDPGTNRVYLVDRSGGEPRLVVDTTPVSAHASFVADGRSILYSAQRAGVTNLWERSLDDDRAQQLTFGGGADLAPDVSRDGAQVIFDVDVTSAPLVEVTCTTERRLTPGLVRVRWLDISPDGAQLVYQRSVQARLEIVLRTLATGDERVLGTGRVPAFLDARRIAWADDRDVRLMQLDTGAITTVAHLPGIIRGMALGEAGLHVLVARESGSQGWDVDVATGTVRASRDGLLGLSAPRGGWRVLLRGAQIEVVPPGGAAGDPSNAIQRGQFLAWDRDGASFLWHDAAVLHRFTVAAHSDEPLCPMPGVVFLAPAPDRKTFYIARGVGRVRRQIITNFADRPRL